KLALPDLTTVTDGGAKFLADGANSSLDISALSSFDGTGNSIAETNRAAVAIDNMLRTWSGVSFTVDGTSTLLIEQFKSVTDGGLTVEGGSYTLPSLSDLDSSNVRVLNGGSLVLPSLTSYTNILDPSGGGFQATGSASVLRLPALTSISGKS